MLLTEEVVNIHINSGSNIISGIWLEQIKTTKAKHVASLMLQSLDMDWVMALLGWISSKDWKE